jgi:hypothetical protein
LTTTMYKGNAPSEDIIIKADWGEIWQNILRYQITHLV